MNAETAIRLYTLALRLFPKGQMAEYGDEMRSVFALRARDAAARGRFFVILMLFKELRDLPAALFAAFRRERRRLAMDASANGFTVERIPWYQLIGSLAPFILIGLACLANLLRVPANNKPLGVLLVLTFLVPFILGIWNTVRTRHIQAWILPLLGFLLGVVSFFLSLLFMIPLSLVRLPYGLRVLYSQGPNFWVAVLLVTGIALWASRSRFRAQLQDWTLLSFLLYGTVMWGIVFTFGDYPVKKIFYLNYFFYLLLSALALAAGSLLYMRIRRTWWKFFWLFVWAFVAIAIAAGGKTAMIVWGGFQPMNVGWVNEFNHSLAIGFWMLLALAFPALLRPWFRGESDTIKTLS